MAPHNFLEKIHQYNLAEIDLFIKRLDELSFIDRDRMFLVGFSYRACVYKIKNFSVL